MEQAWAVRRVAAWEGWCSPCGRGDRPLVLTRSGASGPRAWLNGLGDEDRCLVLTCRVCGQWQVVPHREEDDPETVLVEEVLVEDVLIEEVAPAVRICVPQPVLALAAPRVSPESAAAGHAVLAPAG